MSDAIAVPCTVVDPEERSRVLSRVYSLLIRLAQEKSADRATDANHETRTAEVGPSAQEPSAEQVYHTIHQASKAGCTARNEAASHGADASLEPQPAALPENYEPTSCEGASHGTLQ